jgi:hypothetical protein
MIRGKGITGTMTPFDKKGDDDRRKMRVIAVWEGQETFKAEPRVNRIWQRVKGPRGRVGFHSTRKRGSQCSQPPLGGLTK